MGIELIVVGIAVIANCALGLLVLLYNRQSATSRFYFALCISITTWIIATYLSLHSSSLSQALFWTRFVMVTAVGQALYFYLLVANFPEEHFAIPPNRFRFLLGAGLVVAAVALSPFLFTKLTILSNGSHSPAPGPGLALFLPYAVGLIVAGIWLLIKKYRKSHATKHRQIRLLLTGVVLMFTPIILFNLILPLGFKYSAGIVLSPLFTVIFVGFTAYAIITQHLFDIRVIIRRTVIFAVLLAFAFGVYTTIIVLFTQLFQLSGGVTTKSFIANLIAALIIGFSFEPLRKWISDRTDAWLFKKEYEQQVVIKDLSKRLNDVIALDEALEIVMQTIKKVLHVNQAVTYVFQAGENSTFGVKRVKQEGYSASARLILEDKDFTVSFFAQHGSILLMRDFEVELEQEKELIAKNKLASAAVRQHAIKQAVYKKLESLNIVMAVPLHLNNQPLGLILLSAKLNGEDYHPQDLALLDVIGAQAISSIQKAKLYEGDQMKSEFVSIASHELLTPVSAIEGYLSMILEEHIGKVDKQAEDYLTKVYSSAKRLSLLIKDLLSVSRIEAGTMKIVQQQLDIDKSIKDVLDQLRFIAAGKKIELVYQKPEAPMPPVWGDPDRTTQILVNLVSNGIKYTPEGKVTLSTVLDKHSGLVEINVTDTGMGMTKQAIGHLFSKFYRVDTPETTGIVGTGLGLYITKSLVEKMGGSIIVKSTPGKGSTFSFTLPLFKVETSTVE